MGRRSSVLAAVLVAGCGRVGYDLAGSATNDASSDDACIGVSCVGDDAAQIGSIALVSVGTAESGEQRRDTYTFSYSSADGPDRVLVLGASLLAGSDTYSAITSPGDVVVDFFNLYDGLGSSAPGFATMTERARISFTGGNDVTSTSSTSPAVGSSVDLFWQSDGTPQGWGHIAAALRSSNRL